MENPVPDWLKSLPCAIDDDPTSPQYGWLYIPHADGQWVTAAKLDPFSMKIIEYWRKEQ